MISGIVIIDRTVVNENISEAEVAFLSKRIDIMVIVVPVGQADAISVGYAMSALNGAIHRKRRTTRGTIMSFVRAIR